MRQYEEDGYLVTEYDNGTVVKTLIQEPQEPQEPTPPIPTLEEKVDDLNTQNLIIMDAIATLFETMLGG